MTHVCRESEDPRHAGYCPCGKRIPVIHRDQTLEATLLAQAVEVCERMYGEQAGGYVRTVMERLTLGAHTYGDDAFRGRDNLREALFETPDGSAYAMLDFERVAPTLRDEDREELRVLTVGAMAACINADVALRRVLQHRRELTGS